MPIYDYECKGCHARFEVKQSMADEPLRVCPKCQGEVRRILHPVGIVFKGSGFYTTDHGRKGNGSIEPSETSSKPEASKKEEKTEAAVATSGDTKTES